MKKNKKKMKRFHIHLPERQVNSLRAIAERFGFSVAELIRRIIDDALDKLEEKPHENEQTEEIAESSETNIYRI